MVIHRRKFEEKGDRIRVKAGCIREVSLELKGSRRSSKRRIL